MKITSGISRRYNSDRSCKILLFSLHHGGNNIIMFIWRGYFRISKQVSNTPNRSSDSPYGIARIFQRDKIGTVAHKTKRIEHGCVEAV